MTGTDLEVRTQQVVATINDPGFLAQIEQSLPDGVPLRRFVQIAVTAVRANPALATADENSLFASIIRCAQDGLFADGKHAALVIYKGKVQYLPMVAGVRKIAAEYGWAISSFVVYDNDEFEYTNEPPVVHHRPLRPGADRGSLAYAVAIATHADGRRLQKVMHREEVLKRRAMAQTDKVWKDFEPQMWEKTVVHEIADEIPLSDHERYVRALAASKINATGNIAEALEQLYGPDAFGERVDLESGEIAPAAVLPTDATTNGAAATGVTQQATPAVVPPAAGVVPGEDDAEPEPGGNRQPESDEVAAAQAAGVAAHVLTSGNYKGQTIAQMHALGEEGREWFAYVLKHKSKFADADVAAVQVFVDGTPDAQLQAA